MNLYKHYNMLVKNEKKHLSWLGKKWEEQFPEVSLNVINGIQEAKVRLARLERKRDGERA